MVSAMKCTLLSLLLISLAALGLSFQFKVGGDKGWTKPSANKTEVFNNWARKTRFRVGDSVYFKYKNDSLLVVNEGHYNTCNTDHPISKHTDGSTVIELDHHGAFYFISGKPGHCKAGQRLIIDVLGEHSDEEETSPSPAPSLGPGGVSNVPASAPTSADRGTWLPTSAADKSTISSVALSFLVVTCMFV